MTQSLLAFLLVSALIAAGAISRSGETIEEQAVLASLLSWAGVVENYVAANCGGLVDQTDTSLSELDFSFQDFGLSWTYVAGKGYTEIKPDGGSSGSSVSPMRAAAIVASLSRGKWASYSAVQFDHQAMLGKNVSAVAIHLPLAMYHKKQQEQCL
jgi:hypothetical protein